MNGTQDQAPSETKPAPTPTLGQVWHDDLSRSPMQIVALDDRFVYVKRADSSKKSLANPAGGYPVSRSEFEAWTCITDVTAPTVIQCPGCPRMIAVPADYDAARDWLLPRSWCKPCGGTASPAPRRASS